VTFSWTSWTRAVLTPHMETMLLHVRILPMAARDPAKMMPALTAFKAALDQLEPDIPPVGKYLNRYGTGNGCFSLADVALGTAVTFTHLIPPAKLQLATAYPNVFRYQTMLELRPTFLTALTNVTLGAIPTTDMLVFP
jgi:glutathione S-transferase